ncbi:unnamed protein product [Toxocara canis]|uniref:Uncharacterized protein n=1 Tax=Toxocara canis TaxID=6265 RepID=A0A3P7IS57_TOXCA|nr:unnamed protein product [Toxocara canis]
MPSSECMVYASCAEDARSVVELAKCVVMLLDERERQMAANEELKQIIEAEKMNSGATPAWNISKMAAKFFREFLGKRMFRRNSSGPSNVEKLRIIREHFLNVDQINAYMTRMAQENSKFLHEINMPVESHFEGMQNAEQNDLLISIVNMINAFQKADIGDQSISIMSPRLFSILPEVSKRPQILSPTLFSFQNDGFFSVPDVLNMAMSTKRDAILLMDLAVELSGATVMLNKLYESLKPQIKQVNEVQLPAIKELQRLERNWQTVVDSYSVKQKADLKKRGYAHLEEEQLHLIYDNPVGGNFSLLISFFFRDKQNEYACT